MDNNYYKIIEIKKRKYNDAFDEIKLDNNINIVVKEVKKNEYNITLKFKCSNILKKQKI